MREGLINVPKFFNDGVTTTADIVETAIGAAVQLFGGATLNEAEGFWRDPATGKLHREPIWQIIVAYDEQDHHQNGLVKNLAIEIGRMTEQLAMYVRYASGEVEILDFQPEAKQAA
jgi:hypothetical protein